MVSLSLAILIIISGSVGIIAGTTLVYNLVYPELQQLEKIEFSSPSFDPQQLDRMSELILIGKVVKQSQGPDDNSIPQTKNVVEIERVLRGTYDKPTVNVMTPESNNKVIVEDGFKMKQGERLRLMLFEYKGYYQVSGLEAGIQVLPPERERPEQPPIIQEEKQQQTREEKPAATDTDKEPSLAKGERNRTADNKKILSPPSPPEELQQQQQQQQEEQKQKHEEQRQERLNQLNRTQYDELRELLRIVT